MFYEYSHLKLHYEVIGKGKPVFILHGLGCHLDLMTNCMEPVFQLHNSYKRIYIDLPGMGESDAILEFATSDKILEILISFIQSMTTENFLLVGESYGGYLVRGLLSKLSKRVDGIMLLCPVVIPENEKRNLPHVDMKYIDEKYLSQLSDDERNNFCEYAIIADESTYTRYKNEVLSGLKLYNKEFIQKLKQNYRFTFDVDKAIQTLAYNKPALFICGRQDNCVGYSDLWNLLEYYPRATFSIIDMAGHNLQIEQPQLFNSLVENWLLRIEKYEYKNYPL